jgi:hypothetical protein
MSWKVLHERLGGDGAAGYPGFFAVPLFGITTLTLAANQAYYSRFVPPRDLEVDRLHFRVQAVDAADPAVELAIYDGLTMAKLVSTGALTGQLTVAGRKVVNLSAPTNLEGGKVYYAALASPTAGVASVQAVSISNAGFTEIVGDTGPDRLGGGEAAAYPLPATAAPGNLTTGLPIIFCRERGT